MKTTTRCAGSALLVAALFATGCATGIEPLPGEQERSFPAYEEKKAEGRLAEQSLGIENSAATRAAFVQAANARLDGISRSMNFARESAGVAVPEEVDAIDQEREAIATAIARAFDVSAISFNDYQALTFARLDALEKRIGSPATPREEHQPPS